MNQKNEAFNPFDPTGMFQELRQQSLDNWAKTMMQLVHTDAYSEATAAMLNSWLTNSEPYRRVLEHTMTQTLTNLNLPSRDDVIQLAERLTNIEMRLDDLEAKLDESLRSSREAKP